MKAEIADIPTHLGLILDGNRRWAKEQGLPTLEGHRAGAENFHTIALAAFDRGVQYVSAYVFSNENWSRAEEEVSYLMKLVLKAVGGKYMDDFHQAGVRIVILGRRDGLAKDILKALDDAETRTAENTRGTLALCFNYGGHEELVDAYRQLMERGMRPADLTVEDITSAVYAPEVPALDLIVRTSGEQRLSGYMLWRSDYAELIFTQKHWPDFTEADLDECLAEYARRQRRFGG